MNKLVVKAGIFLAAVLLLLACDKRSKVEQEISEKPLNIKVERFDKAFFETAPQDLPALQAKYPYFFPAGNDDAIWQDKMQNPMWRELYGEVQKKFGNFQKEQTEITELVKHLGVPQSILTAVPTDGLFGDDRSDEDQLGATYDELEWAMTAIEMQLSSADFTARQQEVMAIYSRLHRVNQHKMIAIPVCKIDR